MSARYYSSPPPPSADANAVSPVLQALGRSITSRRAAIQYKNHTTEQAADSSIVNHFHTLSRDSLYPPSFAPADRSRTTKFFAKLAAKYPRLSRHDKTSTLRDIEERVGRNGNTKVALAGLGTLAATGLVVGGVAMVAADEGDRFYGDITGAQAGVEGGHGGAGTALLGDHDDNSSEGGDDWGLGRVNGMGSNMNADVEGGGVFGCCFECFSGICGS